MRGKGGEHGKGSLEKSSRMLATKSKPFVHLFHLFRSRYMGMGEAYLDNMKPMYLAEQK